MSGQVDEDGLPVAKPQLGSITEERERASSTVSNSARDNDGELVVSLLISFFFFLFTFFFSTNVHKVPRHQYVKVPILRNIYSGQGSDEMYFVSLYVPIDKPHHPNTLFDR